MSFFLTRLPLSITKNLQKTKTSRMVNSTKTVKKAILKVTCLVELLVMLFP